MPASASPTRRPARRGPGARDPQVPPLRRMTLFVVLNRPDPAAGGDRRRHRAAVTLAVCRGMAPAIIVTPLRRGLFTVSRGLIRSCGADVRPDPQDGSWASSREARRVARRRGTFHRRARRLKPVTAQTVSARNQLPRISTEVPHGCHTTPPAPRPATPRTRAGAKTGSISKHWI